ncbi:molybdopterin-dependent oxidoreductase [uncultured Tateyamaria sp.]|uniref:molybdopterin-dependent oxidoreductase n=1 Tax=uncultured Tateyamaria sp. TaxID=455651 RepID=UPI0026324748|nr:molybdopterin-dependent oxidoreductase [uncultured Tateyamaria sp.]
MSKFWSVWASTLVALCITMTGAGAASLAAPSGGTILVVSGAITNHNHADHAAFDADMLRALDWVEVETFTSFTEGPQVFAGPTLASLLDAVGAQGGTLHATAINDYSVEIPAQHAQAHRVILAVERNGEPMRIRDKGPIWIIYPMTEDEARKRSFDREMIWQLDRIRVE